ncbi:MAG: hypothetical protein IH950_00275 [Bacteroidetes bacterium]|nr:hypothetical protein [Bacteroidota bacterium]
MCIIKVHLKMLRGSMLGLKKVVERKGKNVIFASPLYAGMTRPTSS